MPNYDFQTLSGRDFEELSRSLLQKEFGITFESFKQGKDEGVDLYYAECMTSKRTIVQAKHWLKSGYAALKRTLISEELKKIRILKPERYIVTTSVSLSPPNKRELAKELSPFVLSTADIYGKDDINNLLEKFPEVERDHFKLWISSTNVLDRILHNGVIGRSEFVKCEVKSAIARYVQSKESHLALNILNEHRFLVVKGVPGIGKTMLAKMLIFQLLGDGYELVSIGESITEAENVWNPSKKQVFYFDDFLGANYLEAIHVKNYDNLLIAFIKRVKSDSRKRFILTSRTVILNQAKQKFQKLDNKEFSFSEHEINIKDYDDWTKAQILYNHLFFSNLKIDQKQVFIKDKNYWKIIKHKSFSPRLIEFITNDSNLKNLKQDDCWKFINDSLDNPTQIWREIYEVQVDDYSRFLIGSLFSMGECEESIFQSTFDSRLEFEIEKNGFKKENNVYNLKIRELLGSFLTRVNDNGRVTYKFFDPSIPDFLINYFNGSPSEKWRLLESAIYIEQLTTRFNKYSRSVVLSSGEQNRLYKLLLAKESTLETISEGSRDFSLLEMYCKLFSLEVIKDKCKSLLQKINFYELDDYQLLDWLFILDIFSSEEWWISEIKKYWRDILDALFKRVTEQSELESVLELFDMYDQDYDEYIQHSKSETIVQSSLSKYWESKVDEVRCGVDEVKQCTTSVEVSRYIQSFYDKGCDFNRKFKILENNSLEDVLNIDCDELALDIESASSEDDYLYDFAREDWDRSKDYSGEIDRLFSNSSI